MFKICLENSVLAVILEKSDSIIISIDLYCRNYLCDCSDDPRYLVFSGECDIRITSKLGD